MIEERVNDVIGQFGKDVGIEGLCLDERGYCCLFFDDIGINLEIDEENETLFLYAYLGDLPKEGERLPLYETLLDANMFNFSPGGVTIGIDTEQNLIALSMLIPAVALDVRSFTKTMEQIISRVQYWRETIGNLSGCT